LITDEGFPLAKIFIQQVKFLLDYKIALSIICSQLKKVSIFIPMVSAPTSMVDSVSDVVHKAICYVMRL